jgi:HpiC1 cyclase
MKIVRTILLLAAAGVVVAGSGKNAPAKPTVVNPSFEEDRFGTYPGYARQEENGKSITGWSYTGNVGINPWWKDPAEQKGPNHPFSDNAVIPHGKQVALLQNTCTLSQSIRGFKAGKKYRVTYHENARHQNRPGRVPKMQVTLDGEVIVSEHAIDPVQPMNARNLPYDFVESAVFEPPLDGAYDLVFTTTVGTGVTALIDDVRVEEVAE